MVVGPRVMYLDCFSGAAGDMLLGALIDAGLPVDVLRTALGALGVRHELRVSRVTRGGLSATKVDVFDPEHVAGHVYDGQDHHHHGGSQSHGHHVHRSLADINTLVNASGLSQRSRTRALELFGRLGQVEADIHGVPLDEVHFHEVGGVDSIVDIVGVVLAMEWFDIGDVVASPLNVGGGTVEIAHGTYPVPAPATLQLLAGVPVYNGGPDLELVTPTGALLVSSYAKAYGSMPPMTIARSGYGAGTRDFPGRPNVVRVVIGERMASAVRARTLPDTGAPGPGTVVEITCEIDDMNPQLFGPASDAIFAAGAVDVFLTAVQMKKGRPGTLLTALASEDARRAVCDAIFRNTTTLGLRIARVERETLDRTLVEVPTSGGAVRVKISGRGGEVFNAVPEFDDCLRIARVTGRTVKEIQSEALRAWFESTGAASQRPGM